ncbi:glyoxalase [Rathayibacter rathayi]|uniref:Glyoxalase n=1 Tax=Rathayibacter rathayi TaxID=33887 RepID=A0ABD6WC07_RATRA|nr:VOC family protein [Rathayibacter rathayi]AZZ47893.1 glyoxalase [Rathayibacter rathayi]MWV75164.1 glyoxalase [Rathayibacter rathayi NCPPB 2980 = VKM Ac-1601]PPF15541.1 glyoxalase [Rathayibacter rathayi]PPF26039.1 glyoxalase [Rathayibacter rathayi]PPF51317.1 glyoxalase [Rathayibacter rathayi]
MAVDSLFVNLPVTDLKRSKAFYTALGWTLNPLFSNDDAACFVASEHVYAMLLVHPFFSTFTSKEIIDARTQVQGLFAVSVGSREEVDELLAQGLASGGAEPVPAQDLGFMYSRDLEDPDGHIWEFLYMDPAAAEAGPPQG